MLNYFGIREGRKCAKEEREENLKTMIHSYIQCGEVPISPGFINKSLKWSCDYEKEAYEEYGNKDYEYPITYTHNSHGYRCCDFTESADITVVTIGCSITYGFGLPQNKLFHEVICQRIREVTGKSVVNFNLAMGGHSNDYMGRNLALSVPVLKPDLLLINFTILGRREFFSSEGTIHHFLPCWRDNKWYTPMGKIIFEKIEDLRNSIDDVRNFFINFSLIKNLCIANNCSWLYSFTKDPIEDRIGDILDSNCVGPLNNFDKARDNRHIGIKSHLDLADRYWNKVEELKILEKIC